jgi:hypothetical protein
MEEGFGLDQQLSTPPIFWPSLLAIRAGVHGDAGDTRRALVLIQEAREALRGAHPAMAEVAIAHGDILLGGPAPDLAGARTAFELAAGVCADRGARMLELQALTRLAAVHPGDPAENRARDRLREVYETFTEGLDTPPLQAAAAVLAATP